jgi:hypothetical protein
LSTREKAIDGARGEGTSWRVAKIALLLREAEDQRGLAAPESLEGLDCLPSAVLTNRELLRMKGPWLLCRAPRQVQRFILYRIGLLGVGHGCIGRHFGRGSAAVARRLGTLVEASHLGGHRSAVEVPQGQTNHV